MLLGITLTVGQCTFDVTIVNLFALVIHMPKATCVLTIHSIDDKVTQNSVESIIGVLTEK